MAKLIGFPHVAKQQNIRPLQTLQNVYVYHSSSKGDIPINKMNEYHLINAVRKHLSLALKSYLSEAKNIREMVNKVNIVEIEDLINSNEVLNELYNEAQKRGLT